MTEDTQDTRTGHSLATQTLIPQFLTARPCSHCPFRVGSELGRLGQRTAGRVAAEIDADMPFSCHKTTSEKGRGLNHPKARYCAGSMLYSLAREASGEAERPTFMALGQALGLWRPEQLEPVPVLSSRAEFLEWHAQEDV